MGAKALTVRATRSPTSENPVRTKFAEGATGEIPNVVMEVSMAREAG
jgi:hypothetical protein